MLLRLWMIAAFSISCLCAQAVGIQITESAGIRRTGFPASARVHFQQGDLRAAENARLTFNGKEAPAQYSAEALWPDGSVEWLDVDWNVSVGPGETRAYRLEYGSGVKALETPRGLSVTEDADSIQVGGKVRFSKSGSPLLLSVMYRAEDIGRGINGVFVTDDAGQVHDLSKVSSLKTEIVKRGPLLVVIRYSGAMTIDGSYSAPFVITAEMVSGKTLVKISASVEDPARRLREIGVGTPFAFGPLPWVWDFGTARWTYGSMRKAGDSVLFTQGAGSEWDVQTGSKGQEQPFEKSIAASNEAVEWSQIQDGKEVVTFAVERSPQQSGTWRVSFDGEGQTIFRFAPTAKVAHHEIAVFEHFIGTPVQLTAPTSPASLLSPLKVDVENAGSRR